MIVVTQLRMMARTRAATEIQARFISAFPAVGQYTEVRVLLAPHGTRGDVQPMVALAVALRARGHRVPFVVPSNFVGWIRARGFAAESNGVDAEEVLRAAGPNLQ